MPSSRIEGTTTSLAELLMDAQPAALFLLSGLGSLPEFYLFYVLLGGVGFAAVNVPIIANVGLWFTRNKGLALGIVSAGGALGHGVVPFVAAQLIEASGWRTAYLTLAVAYLLVGPALALMVRTPPPLAGPARGGAASGAVSAFPLSPVTSVTWSSVAAMFCCVTMAVPIVHTVSMLTDHGVPYADAVRMFLVIMAAGVLGRLVLGKLTDRLGGLRSYLLTSALQTILLFWFTRLQSLPALYLLSALFGIGFSGVMTALWVCVRELVPARLAGIGSWGGPRPSMADYVRGRGPEAWPTPPPEGARVGYAQGGTIGHHWCPSDGIQWVSRHPSRPFRPMVSLRAQ